MIPLPYLFAAFLAACIGSYGLGRVQGARTVRDQVTAAEAKTEALAAKLQAQQANQTVKVVTEYVDRIQTVEKHVPVVRDRLVRVCEQARGSGVPSRPGNPDASATPNAPDRRTDLAGELVACRENAEQLRAFQQWKRQHGG